MSGYGLERKTTSGFRTVQASIRHVMETNLLQPLTDSQSDKAEVQDPKDTEWKSITS
jgi:hypothetical protein